jgi:hypothetical protein
MEHIVNEFTLEIDNHRRQGAPYVCRMFQALGTRGLIYTESFCLFALEDQVSAFADTLLVMDLLLVDRLTKAADDRTEGTELSESSKAASIQVPARVWVTIPFGQPEERLITRVVMLTPWQTTFCSLVIPQLPAQLESNLITIKVEAF